MALKPQFALDSPAELVNTDSWAPPSDSDSGGQGWGEVLVPNKHRGCWCCRSQRRWEEHGAGGGVASVGPLTPASQLSEALTQASPAGPPLPRDGRC